MLGNISDHRTTPVAPTATTVGQAIGTTLVAGVVVVVAVMLTFPLWMFSLRVFGASNDMLDKAEGMLWLSFLLVPIASAAAYWLALFRLRSEKMLRTWLETFVFSLVYWLVMPILLGAGLYALQALQLLNQNTAISPGAVAGPWDTMILAGEAPGLILFAVLIALCTSGIGLGAAWFFARWDKVQEAHLHSRGWLEFLLVLGGVTIATFLTGLEFVYLTMLNTTLSLIPVPAAMLAGIAAWTTYRTFLHAGLTAPSATGTARKES
ncbi:MAG TPA: hypothetical protein VEH81_01710 [Ktedonobacteraceae bacterium]|nr:hypothetical protein [Ktedonobacteraceae bacterium]